ncbi:hypothetical protein B0J17DRAFT_718865 [Rhizoctonia solani]|nr:hypothetical protein B0J17DRAFT_718865 [Rhizoctonia solani]
MSDSIRGEEKSEAARTEDDKSEPTRTGEDRSDVALESTLTLVETTRDDEAEALESTRAWRSRAIRGWGEAGSEDGAVGKIKMGECEVWQTRPRYVRKLQ